MFVLPSGQSWCGAYSAAWPAALARDCDTMNLMKSIEKPGRCLEFCNPRSPRGCSAAAAHSCDAVYCPPSSVLPSLTLRLASCRHSCPTPPLLEGAAVQGMLFTRRLP